MKSSKVNDPDIACKNARCRILGAGLGSFNISLLRNPWAGLLYATLLVMSGMCGVARAESFAGKAFQYEEYAWLKANGRVDRNGRLMSSVLQRNGSYFGGEYNKKYAKDAYLDPVVQDRIPLAELSSAPELDGRLDDACWQSATRSIARVAFPDDDRDSPQAEYSVWAGRHQGWLYLAFQTDRPARKIAVIETSGSRAMSVEFDDQGKAALVPLDLGRRPNLAGGAKLFDRVFSPRAARFIRVDLRENSGAPGIDELEVFGPNSANNLALAKNGAKASASSCLADNPLHKIQHLNDGLYGNEKSWIGGGSRDEWIQVELAAPTEVARVKFGRDRTGRYQDRLAVRGAIKTSMDGRTWAAAAAFPAPKASEAPKTPDAPRTPAIGKCNADNGVYEVAIPLASIAGWEKGVTVNVGMGGMHLPPAGRAINFIPSRLSLAQVGPCVSGNFKLRVSVANDGGPDLAVKGNAPSLQNGLTLAAGQSQIIDVPAKAGVLGPEFDVSLGEGGQAAGYELHLFQYDPLGYVLKLMDDMIDRLSGQGLEVDKERQHLAALRNRHAKLSALQNRDIQAERSALLEARLAKRELFFRNPELQAIRKILFVKRQAFRPSHNYSAQLDGKFVGGGAVCILDIPMVGDRLVPDAATNTELFSAGEGVADTPMADFDAQKIYFCYRKSRAEYYHLMSMNPDGSGVKQLTDGYFHDNWPCPLPDGGLAFISTRIGLRFLCWRPQAFVLYRMEVDGSGMRPLSFSNLSEWAPSVMSDGRIIWTRSEYQDKGANFGHTLWAIRPDGTAPELVFGNGILQPSGYGNGRTVPGTAEISCTMMSHFGDINGPIALCDVAKGRFNPDSITNITPEVLSVGNSWPVEECFRECVPISKDLFLVSHAPRTLFGLYVMDRYGNREHLYSDTSIESLCPTPFRAVPKPPVLGSAALDFSKNTGTFILQDVYQGLGPTVKRGTVKYLRVVEEVNAKLEVLPDGKCREDHPDFTNWYATPTDRVNGPFGWPTYVAKASHGVVPVAEDGSAEFHAPARKVLYFEALDKDFNEIQRMRSVVQLQPGETRGCVGCHEGRDMPPTVANKQIASNPMELVKKPWEGRPLSFERDVQPVFDKNCIGCHDAKHKKGINLTGVLDSNRVPASYRSLISQGLVHYADMNYEKGGVAILPPFSLGTMKSKLVQTLAEGHHKVTLSEDDWRRIKLWIDCNCPLWPDYINLKQRPAVAQRW